MLDTKEEIVNNKIKIDLLTGNIEAEGSQEFVEMIYNDFKDKLTIGLGEETPIQDSHQIIKKPLKAKAPKKSAKSKGSKPTLSILKDLNLDGDGNTQGLREFFGQHKPSTNFQRNLIFTYYLQYILEITDITLDHIYSCYRHISSLKVPQQLQQSLWDTSFRKGWLDTSQAEEIKVAIPGMNYLEHDMPKMLIEDSSS